MKELTLNNGEKIPLSGDSVGEYVEWRDVMIRRIGKELALNLPKMYGSVEFNIQNGKFVNANLKTGVK